MCVRLDVFLTICFFMFRCLLVHNISVPLNASCPRLEDAAQRPNPVKQFIWRARARWQSRSLLHPTRRSYRVQPAVQDFPNVFGINLLLSEEAASFSQVWRHRICLVLISNRRLWAHLQLHNTVGRASCDTDNHGLGYRNLHLCVGSTSLPDQIYGSLNSYGTA